MKKIILLLLTISFLFSCSRHQKGIFYSWVDNLSVRSIPELNGDPISFINEGEEVECLGDVSEKEIEIILRGKKINSAFYKVKLKNGQIGWVFGGALQKEHPFPNWKKEPNEKTEFDFKTFNFPNPEIGWIIPSKPTTLLALGKNKTFYVLEEESQEFVTTKLDKELSNDEIEKIRKEYHIACWVRDMKYNKHYINGEVNELINRKVIFEKKPEIDFIIEKLNNQLLFDIIKNILPISSKKNLVKSLLIKEKSDTYKYLLFGVYKNNELKDIIYKGIILLSNDNNIINYYYRNVEGFPKSESDDSPTTFKEDFREVYYFVSQIKIEGYKYPILILNTSGSEAHNISFFTFINNTLSEFYLHEYTANCLN